MAKAWFESDAIKGAENPSSWRHENGSAATVFFAYIPGLAVVLVFAAIPVQFAAKR